ncbi:tetratricopeptide repeat protein [Sulfuriflexus mobilis]|uniref:tetratricopeptide repeat protein n=1 Tax=Sulfuriflexus mobilis TaxID=1811807 RepID=UPI000F8461D0|nr:tetratricopeptide repeat protein [Sulfuriflexus mobilis]
MYENKLLKFIVTLFVPLWLSACGSLDTPLEAPVDVPVEERDHGAVSSYRIVPPPAEPGESARPDKAPHSALARLHDDARQQLHSGQYPTAVSTLERALRIAPRDAGLWQSLAEVRLQQRRFEMARNLAAKSNSLATGDKRLQAQNWRIIAQSHQAQGNQAAAQRAWLRVTELSR